MYELEKNIENRVVKFAKKIKLPMKKKERGELLDRMFFIPGGKIFIIEFKRVGEKAFKRQERKIKQLREIGYDIEIYEDSNKAIEAIKTRILEAQTSAEKRSARNAAKRMSRAFS